jgi:ubiquinone/menaquinone biosynthesis C-methylase UbiE
MNPSTAENPWDVFADEYAGIVAEREQAGLEESPLVKCMLEELGDVRGLRVLDACCGEGVFSRLLQRHGAQVTGVDLSPRLIEIARRKDPGGSMDYRVADLGTPDVAVAEHFDAISCHLGLNDVADYCGFAGTIASVARPGARIILGFNNPYSAVVRGHINDYFDSGARPLYGGLSERGVQAHYYHRTLEEYIDAFLEAGLQLVSLRDVVQRGAYFSPPLPERSGFPLFMVLSFEKP